VVGGGQTELKPQAPAPAPPAPAPPAPAPPAKDGAANAPAPPPAVPAPPAPKDEAAGAAKDQDQLQGTWQVVEFVQDGFTTPAEAAQEIKMTFKGDRMSLVGPEGKGGISIGKREFSYKLDPAQKPKILEVSPLDGPFKGKMAPAIYELNGDELKICMPNADVKTPPAELKSTKGSKVGLFVLKRVKP
jgi:uncharacterized protein (TIGR03067 family)